MTKTSTRGGLLTRALSCGCAVALAASLAPAAGVAWAANPSLPSVGSTSIKVNVGTDANGTYAPFVTKTVDITKLDAVKNAVLYSTSAGTGWGVVATDRYVTLDSILEDAGLDNYWTSGAKLAYSSDSKAANSSEFTTTYADAESMNFYGATQKDTNAGEISSPGGTKVEPGLALYAYSAVIDAGATAMSLAEDMYGALESSTAALIGTQILASGGGAPAVTYMNGLTETQYKSGADAALNKVTVGVGGSSVASVNVLVEGPTNTGRIYGQEWADTMAKSVSLTFGTAAQDNIVLTTSETFQDALAASGLAGALQCPVIMTDGDELTPQAGDLIQKYLGTKASGNPVNVYVIGGEVAIKPAVVDAVKTLPAFYGKQAAAANSDGLWVERIAGDEAWDTSLKIYNKISDLGQAGSLKTGYGYRDVIVACSGGFEDAMSIAPFAYATGTPIVLTDNENKLSDSVLGGLSNIASANKSIVNIVGGPAVVSYQVDSQLAGKASKIYRTFGQSAYDTSNQVATLLYGDDARFRTSVAAPSTYNSAFKGATVACLATGENYLDALASAAYCATNGSTLLLVSNSDSTTIDGFLTDNAKVNGAAGAELETSVIFGGEGVLGKAVQMEADRALTKAAK